MPRTTGRNTLHLSQVAGWCEADRPLVEVPAAVPDEIDLRIAAQVAERIPDGACLQAGIGSIPNGVLAALGDHRDLGIHTELLSDGVIDLVEQGVVTGVHKVRRPTKVVATFALGSRRLYDFLDQNPAVELLPVDWVNDPRIIAQERDFVSINATVEVDLLGQAASETIGGQYWSGSGGQADCRPRRHVLTRRPGRSSSCRRGPATARCRRIVGRLGRGVGGHDPEEHRPTRWSPSTAWPSSRGRTIRERRAGR